MAGGSGLSQDSPFKMQAIFNGDQPEHYIESYRLLKKYIDESLDLYKDELQSVLFPIFTQLYLGMIQSKFNQEAKQFYYDEKYQFMFNYRDELKDLDLVDHTKLGDPNVSKYLTNKFQVKISLYAFQLLIHFVKLNQLILLLNIMNRSLNFQLSGEKTLIDLHGAMSVLVNEDVQELNQSELILGKLPEFSPEYQAAQNYQMALGAQVAGGGPID